MAVAHYTSPDGFFAELEPSLDEDQSYIMYHGTTLAIAKRISTDGFRPSSNGMLGPGVYVTRSFEKATHYPVRSGGEALAVLRLRVRVGRVKTIDCQRHPLQKSWSERGYDTAWVPPDCGMVRSGLEENCVHDPSRITVLSIMPNIRTW